MIAVRGVWWYSNENRRLPLEPLSCKVPHQQNTEIQTQALGARGGNGRGLVPLG